MRILGTSDRPRVEGHSRRSGRQTPVTGLGGSEQRDSTRGGSCSGQVEGRDS